MATAVSQALHNISIIDAQLGELQRRKEEVLSRAAACIVTISAHSVELCKNGSMTEACSAGLGGMSFTSGLQLISSDPDFGGLSGLDFDAPSDSLISVSDLGSWYVFQSRPAAVGSAFTGPLHSLDGKPLAVALGSNRHGATYLADAEAVTRAGGSLLVSFERKHRIWQYTELRGNASTLALGADLTDLCTGEERANAGVEVNQQLWRRSHHPVPTRPAPSRP